MSSQLFVEIETGIEFLKERGYLEEELPDSITNNLKYPLRAYQHKALENFLFYLTDTKYKNIENKHLLFHMATGSGKTNVLVATMLYFYAQGYRNFIFFVNSTNIISKTKENLLHKESSKYLFADKIIIDSKPVEINVINDTFHTAKANAINVMFTTIQALHTDLETTVKENSISYDDFSKDRLVLIADEAHHLNASTKTEKDTEQSWEQTTKNLLKANPENIMLEFTATQGLTNTNIAKKYEDKIIADYPLKNFRDDKYSKDIKLISDNFNDKQRMLQAVMISEYRRLIAKNELDISLKPVIMFKSVKNTVDADNLHEEFVTLIEKLKVQDIDSIFNSSTLEALAKLKNLIVNKQDFVDGIKYGFSKDKTLVIHSKTKDNERKLSYLNSLEEITNPIRAIFAIDILNEGWDVLNLYDIVKLDEIKKSKTSTISEAQLIGRGARYYPFVYNDEDKYKRKFDKYPDEPAKILEEMYFHSINQSDYINALTKELQKMGLVDDNSEEYQTVILKVKQSFLDNELYKSGVIYVNEKVEIDKQSIQGVGDYIDYYKVQKRHIDNQSHEIFVYEKDKDVKALAFTHKTIFKISELPDDIVRLAINKKPFFYFSSLKKYFINLKSISQFMNDSNYLGDIEFTLHSTKEYVLDDIDKVPYILEVLELIEKGVKKNAKTYMGSHKFYPERISAKIKPEKELKLKKSDSPIHRNEDWYIFEPHNGTIEEKDFTEFIFKMYDDLIAIYDDVKLMRNEKSFHLVSFDKARDGAGFEPDFILLLKTKDGCYHQVFCEPKGGWTRDALDGFEMSNEKWKNDFLKAITECTSHNNITLENINKDGLTLYENQCYRVYGLPFYNNAVENEFKEDFKEMLL